MASGQALKFRSRALSRQRCGGREIAAFAGRRAGAARGSRTACCTEGQRRPSGAGHGASWASVALNVGEAGFKGHFRRWF